MKKTCPTKRARKATVKRRSTVTRRAPSVKERAAVEAQLKITNARKVGIEDGKALERSRVLRFIESGIGFFRVKAITTGNFAYEEIRAKLTDLRRIINSGNTLELEQAAWISRYLLGRAGLPVR